MTKTKRVEIEDWGMEPLPDRLHRARAILAVYGLLAQVTNEKMRSRIDRKFKAKEGKNAQASPTY